MKVNTAYYRSPLGLLKIGAAENCIVEVNFDDAATEESIRAADNSPDPLLIQCIEQLIAYFNGRQRTFDLPVNPAGTPFQQHVWNELLNIPYGRTISYLELSRRLGNTKAIRAVGAANGKNPIAIIIPCHRVVGAKNELVGYAGGLWRKRYLLDLEKRVAHGVQTLFNYG
ncbi:MAG TPA: methylated-DNA--[protein]-cysteine S-methyltransferase [Flavitalea sp.]|nr:methylated-DNA--[protein]-cysteine S-methyltransferase [Flavitalea sp.]